MPTVRSSFTPNGQNFEIPKIDFCDVITSELYSYTVLLPFTGGKEATRNITYVMIIKKSLLTIKFRLGVASL